MANTPASISLSALQRLKQLEGAIPYVYDDGDGTWPKRRITSYQTKGHPTIGVGHLIRSSEQARFRRYLGRENMPEGEMLALLRNDVQKHSRPLRPKIKTKITQAMWDALVLQSFNTGPNTRALRTAITRINAEDWRGAQAALASGAKTSKGKTLSALVSRRAEEAQLFLQQGIPGAIRQLTKAGSRSFRIHQRRVKRFRKKQLILGAGAALLASIAVIALVASRRMR